MTTEQISCFLDTAIRNRLAVRLLAEQHIAISRDLQYPERASKNQIGVVELNFSPKKMIGMVGSFVSDLCEATLGASPQIIIDGEADATFAYVPATPAKPRAHPPHSYIPVHLEYILRGNLNQKSAFGRHDNHAVQVLRRESMRPLDETATGRTDDCVEVQF